MGKAKLSSTSIDLIKGIKTDKKKQSGRARADFAGASSGIAKSMGSRAEGSTSSRDNTNYLPRGGGIMTGPIAFRGEAHAILATDKLNLAELNVGTTTQVRGLIFVSSVTSTALHEIIGKKYDGQMLIITGISGQTAITISHATGVAGQILCPGDTSYTLSNDESVTLIDDFTAGVQSWRIISSSVSNISGVSSGDSIVWTGQHTFTGTTHVINSADIFIGDSTSDNVSINARVNSNIIPDADDTYDLGSGTLQWDDLYIDGIGYIDTLDIEGVQSSLIPLTDNAYSLGTSTFEWRNLYIDGTAHIDTLDVDGSIEINGALNHDGSTVGFYSTSPITQQQVTTMTGAETLVQTIAKINVIIASLGTAGIGIFRH